MTLDQPTQTIQQPTLRFLFAHPWHTLALGFGSGLSPWAAGTIGTLFAWASFLALEPLLAPELFLLLILVGFVVGIVAIEKAGKALNDVDHGAIVWDEIIAFWGVLWLLNTVADGNTSWQLIAFALFRFFDIKKPWPASYYDQRVKNGYGVMMDDVIAALYSVLALAVLLAVYFLFLQPHI